MHLENELGFHFQMVSSGLDLKKRKSCENDNSEVSNLFGHRITDKYHNIPKLLRTIFAIVWLK